MSFEFKKAARTLARLRLGITGPSGAGKTTAALRIAQGLGGSIAVIDTERGSASLYADVCDFDVLDLAPPYTPERYIEAVRAAEKAGYKNIIVDSVTHEWNGVGGCLQIVDQVANASYRGNTWSAWSEVTPRHQKFVDVLLASPANIIVTMRSKTETAQVQEGGKAKVVKLGMKAEQRDGIEYEMTVVLDLMRNGHFATSSKDRTGLFEGKDAAPVTVETGQMLGQWLASAKPEQRDPYKDKLQLVRNKMAEANVAEQSILAVYGLASLSDAGEEGLTKISNRLDATIKRLQEGAQSGEQSGANDPSIVQEAA